MTDEILSNILIILCFSIIFISLLRRFHLPPAIAYFFVGIMISNQLVNFDTDMAELRFIGEIGIVFLLFTIGLEFSLARLTAMYKSVFVQGGLQVLCSLVAFSVLFYFYSSNWLEAIFIASAVALSSTAIVFKLISEESAIHTRGGMLSTAILLFQDLAVIPLLIIIPALGSNNSDVIAEISIALFKGLSALVIFLTVGRKLLPKFLHFIAESNSDELFVLSTLFIALITAWITHALGLSMALGAFLAGMTLGESQYRHQITADIRPFRDILMGLFFISVGMLLDTNILLTNLFEILLLLVITLLGKAIIIFGILKLTGEAKQHAMQSALMLPQIGEFGFVIIALLLNFQLIDDQLASIVTSVGILSMMVTPSLIRYRHAIVNSLVKPSEQLVDPKIKLNEKLHDSSHHVIIFGFGRIGQTLARFLQQVNIPYIAVDKDPLRVEEASAAEEAIFYGDATQLEIIKSASIHHAAMVVITFDDVQSAHQVIEQVHSIRPTLSVLARTQNESNIEKLLAAGATEVLPESLEASLMLCGHCLAALNVPLIQIVKLIQRIREDNYSMLKGFYHGEITDISLTMIKQHKKLHAVKLNAEAFATGKSLRALGDHLAKVDVKSVRYDGQIEQPPNIDRLLKADDILILIGEPQDIDAVENFLFAG